jgi:hypothetical protein
MPTQLFAGSHFSPGADTIPLHPVSVVFVLRLGSSVFGKMMTGEDSLDVAFP